MKSLIFAILIISSSCTTYRSWSPGSLEAELRGDLMFLKLEINEKTGLFLVDTGAGVSILDINQVRRFQVASGFPHQAGSIDGIGGSKQLILIGKHRVAYRGMEIANLQFYGADIAAVNQYFAKQNMVIHGIVGSDFFRRNRAVIDFETSQIHLPLGDSALEILGK